ncbi:MAG: cysteine desulfurase [Bacilli bacterium]|nr:cysteine desulfurase [Bacilli bacterium]
MIYLDNAATTNTDKVILDSYYNLVNKMFMNTSSLHAGGVESARLLQLAREQIGDLFKVNSSEVIFTSGATESNNLAIKGVAFKYKNRGKHLITTAVEHPSVLNTFKQLRDEFGFDLTILPVNANGTLEPNTLKANMRDDTILVSIMAVNNEVGSINDLSSLADIVHSNPKTFFHSDTTQSIGKMDIDYSKIDLFVLSSHKLYGLKGSGVLIKKKNVELMPLLCGGGQEYNYRSGTNDFQKEVILAKTLRLALEEKQKNYDHAVELFDYAFSHLSKMKNISINSSKGQSPFILNFSLLENKSSVVVEALSKEGIMVSTTSACSSKKEPHSLVLEAMGKSPREYSNSIRISFGKYNTKEEIDIFISTLDKILHDVRTV